LFPGHFLGGVFGLSMIAFFTQNAFATASGNSNLPNGLVFGGGFLALKQLGIEELGLVVVLVAVFTISLATVWVISNAIHGITVSEDAPVKIKFTAPAMNSASKKNIDWIELPADEEPEDHNNKAGAKK
jgi:ammonia channel protein AmtB